MGFGGAALAANQVIRNNRNLLKNKRSKRKLSLVSDIDEKWVDPKSASFDQLMEIRRSIRREHKERIWKITVLTVVGFVLLIVVMAVIPWDLIFTYVH